MSTNPFYRLYILRRLNLQGYIKEECKVQDELKGMERETQTVLHWLLAKAQRGAGQTAVNSFGEDVFGGHELSRTRIGNTGAKEQSRRSDYNIHFE